MNVPEVSAEGKKKYDVTLSPYGQQDPKEGAGVQKYPHGLFPSTYSYHQKHIIICLNMKENNV